MKTVALVLAGSLLASQAFAQDRLLGQIVGGLAGYKIADHYGAGEGGMAAAAVAGSVLGGRYVEHRQQRAVYYSQPAYSPYYRPEPSPCDYQVPAQYAGNSGATSAWISGCEQRIVRQQRALEEQAYREGYR
jgi:uncharacterized protein YcfJ